MTETLLWWRLLTMVGCWSVRTLRQGSIVLVMTDCGWLGEWECISACGRYWWEWCYRLSLGRWSLWALNFWHVWKHFCEKFHQLDTKTILITVIQPKITYCLSTFRLHVGSLHQDWLPVPVVSMRIRQSWQTHKGGDMDQEDWQDESRRGELPVEPRMGQAFTYWRPAPEVNPDEGFRREAETSINSMLFLAVLQ